MALGAPHPEAERLAEYADGVLGADARTDIERHLADCADCRAIVMETRAFLEANPAADAGVSGPRVIPFRSRRWVTGIAASLAVAAALVIGVRLVRPELLSGLFGSRGDRPELQELIAAVANEPTRPVEGRLTGGFKYAPAPSPTRGAGDRAVSPDVRIAAAKIEKLAQANDTPANQASLGTAYLAIGDYDKAIDALQGAADQLPKDARVQNDLAAAYLARASRRGRAEDWVSALAAADRAIAIDAKQPEPRFNRAVALEGLHLSEEALAAWKEYQAIDPSSGWAAEGAARTRALAAPRPQSSLGDPAFDHQTVREQIEDQLFKDWGTAVLAGDSKAAAAVLDRATPLAERLVAEGGDGMALDELRRIRAAEARHDATTVRELATAHLGYSDARARFLKSEFGEASARMNNAASHFRLGASPYAAWGPLYEASMLRRTSPQVALEKIRATRIDGNAENYYNARGNLTWTHGVVLDELERFDLGRERLQDAVGMFRKAGEGENLNATQTILAEAEWFLGDRDRAWEDVVEVLGRADRNVQARRNYYHLLVAAMFSLESGLPHAALEFQNRLVQRSATYAGTAPTQAFLRRARMLARAGNGRGALEDLEFATRAAQGIADAGLRARNMADVQALRAELLTGVDNRLARADADAALTFVRQTGTAIRLGPLLAMRARGRELMGDQEGAEQDLREALQSFESKRANLTATRDRMQAFEEERAAFKELVALEAVRRGNQAEGLRVAERARAGVLLAEWSGSTHAPVDPAQAYAYIPERIAVAYFETLPDRVLGWVLTKEGIEHFSKPMARADVATAVERVNRAIRNGASSADLRPSSRDLMANLVVPVLDRVRGKATIIFIPDGALYSLPFAALPAANGAPLIASRSIGIAPSLTTFLAASARLSDFSASDVLTVGDGHDPEASGLPLLPMANGEATAVAAIYRESSALIGANATRQRLLEQNRTVIHFAGHTIVNRQFPLLSRLLLAPDTDADESDALLASDIAKHRFERTRVVVLATCDGAAGRVIDGEGLVSVGGAFLGAGVPSVIASLWPVDDNAHGLLTTFHRELVVRLDPVDALRASQMSVLRARGAGAPVREWGGFVALGGSRTAVNRDEEVAWHK